MLLHRELFGKIREQVRELKPDESHVSWELTEAEMLENLEMIERILERIVVRRDALAWCKKVEDEARGGGR